MNTETTIRIETESGTLIVQIKPQDEGVSVYIQDAYGDTLSEARATFVEGGTGETDQADIAAGGDGKVYESFPPRGIHWHPGDKP